MAVQSLYHIGGKNCRKTALSHGLNMQRIASTCSKSYIREASFGGETKSFIQVTNIAGKKDKILGTQAFGKD